MNSDIVGDRSVNTNVAIWVLISTSAAFLFGRLWCRHHSAKLWWDDLVLTISWMLLLVAGALITRLITVGPTTDRSSGAEKRFFFQLQNTSILLTTLATSWTKVAFAITLTRIAQNKIQLCFLWMTIVTANLVLIPGITSTFIPACVDPRARFRPVNKLCWELSVLQSLGSATIVYGGVIDILLALFPWLILRKTRLETREKIGLSVAMSLGALTGVIVILRTFYGLVQGDYNFDFMIFISIFNFLEPCVTIIAQAIPMFRVLFMNNSAKRGTHESSSKRNYISSPILQRSRDGSVSLAAVPISMSENEVWGGKVMSRGNEGLGWGHTRLGERRVHDMI
ncbi:Rhodopsin domain-containing protein [Madurella fahalii]|uniref:Rhodopsin domain-containing protein n=1 Tax=Madurella fahalii TaxID=1157608 RepID=A0ABQ0GL67_9PEZI